MKKFLSLFAAVLFAGSMMAQVTEMTCAEAREAALAGSTDSVVVTGYVTEIATVWSDQYKNISFWMADEGDGGRVLEAFRCAAETQEDAPEVGDLIKVTGKLKKYNDTPEFDAGCTFEMIEKGAFTPEVDEYKVVFAEIDFAGQGKEATTETPGDTVRATKQGVSFFCDNAYGKYGVRCYKGANVTISSEEKFIEKIVFEFYSTDSKTYDGGLQSEIFVDEKEWKVENLESQARMTTITVYLSDNQGVENVVLTENAQKVMVDGVLYIVRDNKMYDVRGTQVR